MIDVEDWNVDVCNFAPYKFFGVRGCGFAYVSPRVASMFHERLLFKAPEVWALGTPAPGNFAAMMAVIDYVCSIGRHFSPDRSGARELFVEGMHVNPYEKGNIFNKDPRRPRRLLMHKREILRLQSKVMQDGAALVPLSLYFKDSRVKVELGLCKGKKLYDKRNDAAEKSARREIDRKMKEANA